MHVMPTYIAGAWGNAPAVDSGALPQAPSTFRIGARSASKGVLRFTLACAAGFVPFIQSVMLRADDKSKITYDDQLAPIFRQRCSACHNPTAKKSDLDVTNYSSLMHGGSSGAVIEPGDPDASHL